MASVNKVILVGRLTADPEIKSFSNGGQICNLRVATNETWKSKEGERKERVEFHSVTIHGDGLIGVAERYLQKGSQVYLEGQLRTRKWQDQSGADRYSTEVVLSGPSASMTLLDPPSGDGARRGGDRSEGRGFQRSEGGAGRGGKDRGGRGNDRGRDDTRGGGSGGGSRGSWGGSGGGAFDDLDDDIPFVSSDFRHERRVS